MGHKPFAAILLAGLIALPIGCGDDDGDDSTPKGGAAGKGGSAGKSGSSGAGNTAGKANNVGGQSGEGGEDGLGGQGGSQEPPEPVAGSGGSPEGGAGADAGGAAGSPEVGGAGGAPEGEGGASAGSGQGGEGGTADPGPTVQEQIDALKSQVCAKVPAAGACESNAACVGMYEVRDLLFNPEDQAACDSAFIAFLSCVESRPAAEFACTGEGELDTSAAESSGNPEDPEEEGCVIPYVSFAGVCTNLPE